MTFGGGAILLVYNVVTVFTTLSYSPDVKRSTFVVGEFFDSLAVLKMFAALRPALPLPLLDFDLLFSSSPSSSPP